MYQSRRGFARSDLAAIVAAVVVLACAAAATAPNWPRREARLAACQANLTAILRASEEYGASYKGALPAFTDWAKRREPGTTDFTAVQRQAVESLRHLTGHDELESRTDWLPQVRYSWLVLWESGEHSLRGSTVCPEDTDLLRLRGQYLSNETSQDPWVGNGGRRQSAIDRSLGAYASTYQHVPASWSADNGVGRTNLDPTIVEQGASDLEYRVPNVGPFGKRQRRLDEVVFPSLKVYVHDAYDRHFAKVPVHFGDPRARQPVLLFDGSVLVLATERANPGGKPNDPTGGVTTVFSVTSPGDPWQDIASSIREVRGYYRWTRSGLRGIDFGADEVYSHVGRDTLEPGSFVTATP